MPSNGVAKFSVEYGLQWIVHSWPEWEFASNQNKFSFYSARCCCCVFRFFIQNMRKISHYSNEDLWPACFVCLCVSIADKFGPFIKFIVCDAKKPKNQRNQNKWNIQRLKQQNRHSVFLIFPEDFRMKTLLFLSSKSLFFAHNIMVYLMFMHLNNVHCFLLRRRGGSPPLLRHVSFHFIAQLY